LPIRSHEQVWVKVNAPVDQGVAEVVSLLNSVSGLETLQSCQGDTGGRDAYVYFAYGNWTELCRLVFEEVGPALKQKLDEDARLMVEATSADRPTAKLTFRAEATGIVASVLRDVLHQRP